MRLEAFMDELICIIQSDNDFSDIRIMKAYPCTPAPSRLEKETIAVGFEEITLSSASVDEGRRAGNVCVYIDIFVPLRVDNSRLSEIFTMICRCLSDCNVLSISADKAAVDVNTASYVMKTKFTFNGEIEVTK